MGYLVISAEVSFRTLRTWGYARIEKSLTQECKLQRAGENSWVCHSLPS